MTLPPCDRSVTFSFYPGLDYITKTEQVAAALRLFGFAPGWEYAVAVSEAQRIGAQVRRPGLLMSGRYLQDEGL